ncbi:MAG TPA: glycosyltransferase family 1 protein, partial [Anaerolineae bacterium]|nr:glycosyltransferase family 1 protein [Anaerolineae bacterium]
LITPRCAGGPSVERAHPSVAPHGPEKGLGWVSTFKEERANGVVIHRVDPPAIQRGDFFADVHGTNLNLMEAAGKLFTSPGGPGVSSAERFDLVHAHDWLVAFAVCALKRIHRIPLISTFHATERGRGRGHLNSPISRAINSTEWRLAHESWRMICASRFMAQEVANYFDVPADRIDVIPNGVNTERFDRWDGVDLSDFRARFATPQERIVLYVGRIVHEKGLHLLVEAGPRVLAQFPEAKFVVAGRGEMLEALRARAGELGVGPKFQFTGFIPDEDRDRLYKVADCAVFPSLYEPFGIVALEAMAAKTPVVVSSVGGLAEVVHHDETGITVCPDSVESLVQGVLRVLRSPEEAAVRAQRAYRQVVEAYNWDRIARQTLAIYERVVEEQRRSDG